MKHYRVGGIILSSLLLCGCITAPPSSFTITPKDGAPSSLMLSGLKFNELPNATPIQESTSEKGNPEFYVTNNQRYLVLPQADGYKEVGIASWYGTRFHSLKTSNGEPYNMLSMTAASKTLPIPTYVKVTNLENGKSVVVRVNDRGPFKPGRIIDLSYAAAAKIGMLAKGTAKVEVEALAPYPYPLPPTNKYYYYLELTTSKNPIAINLYLKRLDKHTEMSNLVLKERKDWFILQAGPYDRAMQADNQAKGLVSLGFKDPRLFQRPRQ
ncbi:MAG: septal ring lytic transglycosylase RlpA family protein [Gammaproteobacteria bacterium]|nr:septal ring lytic transglycosylase RlpA family protein [Gammaproteobacteria bacterium]